MKKLNKKIIALIMVSILGLIIVFGMTGFVLWDWNISNYETSTRGWMLYVYISLLVISAIPIVAIDFD